MFEVIEKSTGKVVYRNADYVNCNIFRYWSREDEPSQHYLYEIQEAK